MNNDAVEALTKLAEELTDQVDRLQKENAELKKQASEKAAAPEQETKPVASSAVSAPVAEATLEALRKVGMLTEEQIEDSRKILLTDVEAPHRILQKILDAQSQTKVASEENISGGTLINSKEPERDPMEDCFDRMERILNS